MKILLISLLSPVNLNHKKMKLYLITQQQNDPKTKKIGAEDWGLLEISKLTFISFIFNIKKLKAELLEEFCLLKNHFQVLSIPPKIPSLYPYLTRK